MPDMTTTEERSAWLASLKVGDIIQMVGWRYVLQVHVTRITPKKIMVARIGFMIPQFHFYRFSGASNIDRLEPITGLAGDQDADVRNLVARNTSTPADALTTLSGDQNATVRYGVSSNTSTPADAVEIALNDGLMRDHNATNQDSQRG